MRISGVSKEEIRTWVDRASRTYPDRVYIITADNQIESYPIGQMFREVYSEQ